MKNTNEGRQWERFSEWQKAGGEVPPRGDPTLLPPVWVDGVPTWPDPPPDRLGSFFGAKLLLTLAVWPGIPLLWLLIHFW